VLTQKMLEATIATLYIASNRQVLLSFLEERRVAQKSGDKLTNCTLHSFDLTGWYPKTAPKLGRTKPLSFDGVHITVLPPPAPSVYPAGHYRAGEKRKTAAHRVLVACPVCPKERDAVCGPLIPSGRFHQHLKVHIGSNGLLNDWPGCSMGKWGPAAWVGLSFTDKPHLYLVLNGAMGNGRLFDYKKESGWMTKRCNRIGACQLTHCECGFHDTTEQLHTCPPPVEPPEGMTVAEQAAWFSEEEKKEEQALQAERAERAAGWDPNP